MGTAGGAVAGAGTTGEDAIDAIAAEGCEAAVAPPPKKVRVA